MCSYLTDRRVTIEDISKHEEFSVGKAHKPLHDDFSRVSSVWVLQDNTKQGHTAERNHQSFWLRTAVKSF